MEATIPTTDVGVLDKAVRILDAVEREQPVALHRLVAATELPKSTVHRLVGALEAHDFLRRGADSRIVQGARFTANWLPHVATPILEGLRDATGESCQLYVRTGAGRLCVASVESLSELRTTVPVGAVLPLDVGDAGPLLREESEALRRGWVESVGQRVAGIASVSAPVFNGPSVVAAVALTGPIERIGRSPGRRYGADVRRAAAEISEALRPSST